MTRLVDDLLDASRVTLGKIHLRLEHVEIGDLIRRAVKDLKPTLDIRRQEVTIALPGQPVRFDADGARMEQVLFNLVSNASKFSPQGGRIKVTAAVQKGPDRDEVVVAVADHGVGIEPALLPHVFDLFIQGDNTPSRAQGGLGIGLTLVRHLVQLHGGSVEAKSRGSGLGSEFVVRLPLTTKIHFARTPPAMPGAGESRRILVVDDNIDAAESIGMLLRCDGHRVDVAFNAHDCLDAVLEFRPEVVLLDIGMPGMDGYQLARRLRAMPESANALLVAVTGYSQTADHVRTREAGFDHHLVKPAQLNDLRRILAGEPA